MELYREYPAWLIFLRRTYAVAAGVLAKLMNLPAPNPEAPREGVVVPPVPDQEPEA